MATAPRRTTRKAAPTKGAASAVSADKTNTVTHEEPVIVDAPTQAEEPITVDATDKPSPTQREQLRALAAQQDQADAAAAPLRDKKAATAAAEQLGVPTTAGIPAAAAAAEVPDVQGEVVPKITEGVHGQVGAVEEPIVPAANVPEPPAPDIATLRALADTSGADPVTPYPGESITPHPTQVLPPVRDVRNWAKEGDGATNTLTARILADGWRARVSGTYQFARRGDRVTAPADIIKQAAKHGVLIIEE